VREILTDAQGHAFELRPVDCPTCGPQACRVLGYRGGEHHRYRLGVATRIVRCRRCGLLFPDPFPFPADSQQLYGDPEKYFERHDEAAKVERSRQLVREMLSRSATDSPKILDIGCGRGEFLAAAQLEGADAMGLELSEATIAYATKAYGVRIVRGTVEQHADRRSGPYDAFLLSAVLEHVHDPDATVAAIASLATPGAVLYIDVPCEPNLLTIVGNAVHRLGRRPPTVLNLSPTFSPFHVYGFNRRALGVLLAKHGFSIESCRVWADPRLPFRPGLDRLQAAVGSAINRVANATGTASNMIVWARQQPRPSVRA
jgi:SAM-dependent methyltransferase